MRDYRKSEIDVWIESHKEQILQDIAHLVSIPSEADKTAKEGVEPFGRACRDALEAMRGIAVRDGMQAEDVDGYCLEITDPVNQSNSGHTIGIWGHLDVVPPGEGWLYPPYSCSMINEYIIGRGVQDNKGPLIAVHYALLYLKENGYLKNIKVSQILGCQEECGMRDVEYYLAHRKVPEYSFVADCSFPVCCGEKGISHIHLRSCRPVEGIRELKAGTVVNSIPSAGSLRVQMSGMWLSAQGIGGHAAMPGKTINAIKPLMEQLFKIDSNLEEDTALRFIYRLACDGYGLTIGLGAEDEISGRLTCNEGLVSQDEDGYVDVELDIRYPITYCLKDALRHLQDIAEKSGFRLLLASESAPYYMSPQHRFVSTLMSAWRDVVLEEYGDLVGQEQKEAYIMGGGTYARKLPNAVGFGSGQKRDFSSIPLPEGHGACHCPDEAEAVENLLRAVRIYITALKKLDELEW